MSKSGRQYADEVRALRAAGSNFPASSGYKLASPTQWSSGQKAAVSREFARLEFRESIGVDRSGEPVADAPEEFDPDSGLTESEVREFFDDSAGDSDEEYDDIDFMDFDEGEELQDEESDRYTED